MSLKTEEKKSLGFKKREMNNRDIFYIFKLLSLTKKREVN